jgi:hypothetical protein
VRLALAAALVVALSAGGARAQADYPPAEDRALVSRILEALMKEGRLFVRRTAGAPPVVAIITPIRASSEPGICEYDVLQVEGAAPTAGRTTAALSAERSYRLVAIEPRAAFGPEDHARRDRACRELEGLGSGGFSSADRAQVVWIAGQLVAQAAARNGAAFERLRERACAKEKVCPTAAEMRRLLTADGVGAVREAEPCRHDVCLEVLLSLNDPMEESKIWWASMGGQRTEAGDWRLKSLTLRHSAIASLADDVVDP